MFSGIIEEIGKIVGKRDRGLSTAVEIKSEKIFESLAAGDSISVDGVCLTVEDIKSKVFCATLSQETLRLTTLGEKKIGDMVNLERSLQFGTRVGGHFLSGHIDFKAKIVSIKNENYTRVIQIKIPDEYLRYFVKKGSVGIDGISLTIADIQNDSIVIWLIPFTIENTTLKYKKTNDYVNVEIDMVVKTLVEAKTNGTKRYEKINKEAIF